MREGAAVAPAAVQRGDAGAVVHGVVAVLRPWKTKIIAIDVKTCYIKGIRSMICFISYISMVYVL